MVFLMLYNYLLEIQQDWPFSSLSRKHPKVHMNIWRNSQNDILELRGETTALERAISDIENELGTIINIFPERNNVQLVLKPCNYFKYPLGSILNHYDCLELQPVRYFAGREIRNILITPDAVGLILDEIQKEIPEIKVKVLKVAPLKKIDGLYPLYLHFPLNDLKQGLTFKQQKALTLAFNSGYYELPRKIYLKNLAKEMNIHRRTFEEHLRKAEKKIMTYLIPSLLL